MAIGLGAAPATSWIGSTLLNTQSPCNTTLPPEPEPVPMGTVSSCVVWLVVGLIIGSLQFEKQRQ